ncbi:transposase [Nocardioides massiliensis]|uniref:transposase n=1 Tax=Nocardioides massiliensis TaxID=1325935 RepID=UPI0024835EF8|nr:transposase [Nocardioides massiliensis]
MKPKQLDVLDELRRSGSVLYRCWQLKEGLRDLYRLAAPPTLPCIWTGGWPEPACRSRIPAFVTLSKTVRANRERVLAAVELGLSNSKLEGLNSKIRLINHRGYGHHSAAALIAMIYLCFGELTIQLPRKGEEDPNWCWSSARRAVSEPTPYSWPSLVRALLDEVLDVDEEATDVDALPS